MNFSRSIVVVLFLAVMIMTTTSAEYRAYQYVVKARNPFSMDIKSHVVTSTLDPQSYLAYHGGIDTLKIDMVRSWMCYGDTSNDQICTPPIARGTASTNEENN